MCGGDVHGRDWFGKGVPCTLHPAPCVHRDAGVMCLGAMLSAEAWHGRRRLPRTCEEDDDDEEEDDCFCFGVFAVFCFFGEGEDKSFISSFVVIAS